MTEVKKQVFSRIKGKLLIEVDERVKNENFSDRLDMQMRYELWKIVTMKEYFVIVRRTSFKREIVAVFYDLLTATQRFDKETKRGYP